MPITTQWILLKLGKNVLLSKCYKLVLVSRNAFFGHSTVALGQSVRLPCKELQTSLQDLDKKLHTSIETSGPG